MLVFRSGLPAVGSLYDIMDLVSYQAVIVSTAGYKGIGRTVDQIDYTTVYSDSELRIFRQYE